jgi:hypothetical protein
LAAPCDSSYNPIFDAVMDGSPVTVRFTINDTAGITVSPTSGLVTTEAGGTATFTVKLNTQPAANVTIGLSSSDTTEGTVSPASLTFTPSNWNTPQTVTVRGVDDQIVDGNVGYTIVTAAATSSDPNYNGLNAADVSVTNNDNDPVRQRESLIVDFGPPYGLYAWKDNASWEQINSVSPRATAKGDLNGDGREELVVDFGVQYGIWIRSGQTWTQLHAATSKNLSIGDVNGDGKDEVVVDFGIQYGIWICSSADSASRQWTQLHAASCDSVLCADLDGNGKDDVVVDFGPVYGTWARMNNSTWQQVHAASPKAMTKGDLNGDGRDELVTDFDTYGLWIYSNGQPWTQLHAAASKNFVTGDVNGDGKDEVVVDFGKQYGTWTCYSATSAARTWKQLSSVSCVSLACGDLDGGGKDDIVVGFEDSWGLCVWYNDSQWTKLTSVTPPSLLSTHGQVRDALSAVTIQAAAKLRAAAQQVARSNDQVLSAMLKSTAGAARTSSNAVDLLAADQVMALDNGNVQTGKRANARASATDTVLMFLSVL